LYREEEGGCAKQFQILGTDPVEGVDDDSTRDERSYFGHCNNKTAGCVETPPEAWGWGVCWLSNMKKLKL
jgi:hypothetical protein